MKYTAALGDASGNRPAGAITPSGRQPLASACATSRDHLAATFGRHARPETMAALANELARLISPFHYLFTAGAASKQRVCQDEEARPDGATDRRISFGLSPALWGLYGRGPCKSTHWPGEACITTLKLSPKPC